MNKMTLLIPALAIILIGCDRIDRSVPSEPVDSTNSTTAMAPGDRAKTDTDRRITSNIRDSITNDERLATSVINVRIITEDGVVTLIGFVKDDDDKQAVAKKAGIVRGVKRVSNKLEVRE